MHPLCQRSNEWRRTSVPEEERPRSTGNGYISKSTRLSRSESEDELARLTSDVNRLSEINQRLASVEMLLRQLLQRLSDGPPAEQSVGELLGDLAKSASGHSIQYIPYCNNHFQVGKDNRATLTGNHLSLTVEVLGLAGEEIVIYPFAQKAVYTQYAPMELTLQAPNKSIPAQLVMRAGYHVIVFPACQLDTVPCILTGECTLQPCN